MNVFVINLDRYCLTDEIGLNGLDFLNICLYSSTQLN